jgi:hypothetical protein
METVSWKAASSSQLERVLHGWGERAAIEHDELGFMLWSALGVS